MNDDGGYKLMQAQNTIRLLCKRIAELKAQLHGTVTTKYHDDLMHDWQVITVAKDKRIEEMEAQLAELQDDRLAIVTCGACGAKTATSNHLAINKKLAEANARADEAEAKLADALSGLQYIYESHGELYGVGWDRLGIPKQKPMLVTPDQFVRYITQETTTYEPEDKP